MRAAIKLAVGRDKPVYLEFGINPFSNSEIQIRKWDTFLTLRHFYLNQKWIVLGLKKSSYFRVKLKRIKFGL